MARITINGVSLDPTAEAAAAEVAGLVSADASGSNYILIQTDGPLTDEQREELAGLGVVLQEYVPDDTYLCNYKASNLAPIRALPYVRWANVYLQGFKVPPGLLPEPGPATADLLAVSTSSQHSNTPKTVDIVFHDDVDGTSPELAAAVA